MISCDGTQHYSNFFTTNCICKLNVSCFPADHALCKLFEQCAIGYVFNRWGYWFRQHFSYQFMYPISALGTVLSSLVFFKMPLLYLYLVSVSFSDFKLEWKYLWHGLPFLVNFIVFIPRFYAVGTEGQLEYLNAQTISEKQIEIHISYILYTCRYLFTWSSLSFWVINTGGCCLKITPTRVYSITNGCFSLSSLLVLMQLLPRWRTCLCFLVLKRLISIRCL